MTDYFASKSGAGAGDGTSATDAWAVGDIVWATVAENTLYLLDNLDASLTVDSSASGGSATALTIIRGDYPGRELSFTDKVTVSAWTETGVNGEYKADDPRTSTPSKIRTMTRNGLPVNKQADNSHGSLEAGYWSLETTSSPDVLYYKPADGLEPSEVFEAGGLFSAIRTDTTTAVDYIEFRGIQAEFCFYALFIDANGTDVPIGCRVIDCNFTTNVIHLTYTGGVNGHVEGNTFRYSQETGVHLGDPRGSPVDGETTWDNGKVLNNIFEYNVWNDTAENGEGHALDVGPYSDDVLIRGNTFKYHGWWDGKLWEDISYRPGTALSFDGATNVWAERNLFDGNHVADLECGPDAHNSAKSYHYIISNKFLRGGRDMDMSAGAGIACGITVFLSHGYTGDRGVYILNNSFSGLLGDSTSTTREMASAITLNASSTSGITGVTIKNNLFDENACDNDISIYSRGATPLAIDCATNIFYRSSGGDYLMVDNGSKIKYPETNSFSAWQIVVSDTGSQNVDPIINDDLKPRIESPAKNAGTFIAEDIYTFDGIRFSNPPSIGAYEYQSFITGNAIVTFLGSGLM